MRDILSLTRGQPLAGQIRSRRICHSVAVFLQLELFWVYILRKGLLFQGGDFLLYGSAPEYRIA
ncbi:hypothetical protein FDP13_11495 [Dickeya sp. ws52]|nr:hypothetical protein FDP13_11495 [Dickeya sp. ws52]